MEDVSIIICSSFMDNNRIKCLQRALRETYHRATERHPSRFYSPGGSTSFSTGLRSSVLGND